MNDKPSYERYQRQIILKDFGIAGQQKLSEASVLVIGAGGLGCPALQYLAAAGVGTIGIIDDDVVSLDNLHRQVLYSTSDVGALKVVCAKKSLEQLNDSIAINIYSERLSTANALEILAIYDLILDGSDNFATRYLVNDACVLLNKPLVFGAVSRFEGQVAIFNCPGGDGSQPVNYRDLFPQPPKDDEVLNCAEAGVLGILPGIIGTMQANEIIKLITGLGQALINTLLTFNALTNETYQVGLNANEVTRSLIPATIADFQLMNYDWLCASHQQQSEISIDDFNEIITDPNLTTIDVREQDELPIITEFAHSQIPVSQLPKQLHRIKTDTVVVFCQTGKRSQEAARILSNAFGESKQIFSLEGGILNWIKTKQLEQL